MFLRTTEKILTINIDVIYNYNLQNHKYLFQIALKIYEEIWAHIGA